MTGSAKPASFEIVPSIEGYAINRNGIALTTPAGKALHIPTLPLAEAIIEEWRRQGKKPNPASMPMTQLTSTVIDITCRQRDRIIEQVANYAVSDLLCHRAEQPEELALQQQKLWQPTLDWCAQRFNAALRVGQGIMPVIQPHEVLQAFLKTVASCDDFTLTGLKEATETTSSLVLGLALMEGHLTAELVFIVAECDALFQMQQWGDDPVTLNRHESIKRDLAVCETWFKICRKL